MRCCGLSLNFAHILIPLAPLLRDRIICWDPSPIRIHGSRGVLEALMRPRRSTEACAPRASFWSSRRGGHKSNHGEQRNEGLTRLEHCGWSLRVREHRKKDMNDCGMMEISNGHREDKQFETPGRHPDMQRQVENGEGRLRQPARPVGRGSAITLRRHR